MGRSPGSAENFALHALTYGADKTIFEAAGKQSLTWTDAEGGSIMPSLSMPGALHASAIRDAGGLDAFRSRSGADSDRRR